MFVSGLKVHLDKELKICLREKAHLIGRNQNDRETKHYEHLTHDKDQRLADVHLAGFAPAFTLSLCDSEYVRKPPVPIASVVMGKRKKKRKKDSLN